MIYKLIIIAIFVGQICHAQATADSVNARSTEPGIEKLNLLGADIHMPPFTDTVLGTDSGFRRALYNRGVVLRSNSSVSYSQNTLNAPVPADQQTYQGERPFVRLMANPMVTYDMRNLHLKNSQLFIAAGLNWVSWNTAGPSSMTMSALYLYKAFAHERVEIKTGYISNDFEFVGLQVGGALSTGSQGVYAVLPYEVGLSRFPLAAPSLNFKLNGPRHTYFKTAIQRSLDPSGGSGTINRNATGFRFAPKGDKLLNVYEIGYNQRAAAASGQTWVRTGYIHNTTPYPNSRTGIPTSGNFCAFFLADHEFYQSDRDHPGHGIYAGVSAMGTALDLNPYTRYYELRLYQEAPFRSRPDDTASLVVSYSTYNPWLIKNLTDAGKTTWRNASTITGSYNLHLSRGVYMSTGLSYHAGPTITPRVANGLIFSTIVNMFF